jgi:di/tricarboxylate transporter
MLGVLALPVSILLGCLLMLVTRCITPQEAYAAIEWRLLVLIAGMIALGHALETTGAAQLVADGAVGMVGDFGPIAVLAAFYLLTVSLTQPMSNQAAALVVLPIALGVAETAGISTRAMAVTVALAASSSFLTPLEPSCLLVYVPGRYRFLDYPRLGTALTVLAFVVTLVLVPRLWPLLPR